jgi:para-nitrobenzyl esterase
MMRKGKPMSLCAKLFGAAAIGWIAAAGAAIGQAALTPIVHAPAGDLQGLAVAGVGEFLGIPYAEPPVGELRWRPPRPVARWAAPLQATKFANTCAQPQRGVFAAPSKTEDCLYLNVFAPTAEPAAGARLPVMVWFHGGGLPARATTTTAASSPAAAASSW